MSTVIWLHSEVGLCLERRPGAWDLDVEDLKRAHQWTPRSEYLGCGSLTSANSKLNEHLTAHQNATVLKCEEFSVPQLRELLRHLLSRASPELRRVYSHEDGRHLQYNLIADMETAWKVLPSDDIRVRDAHCHEAVMWYVHHLTSTEQTSLRASFTLPLLPVADHRVARCITSPTAPPNA